MIIMILINHVVDLLIDLISQRIDDGILWRDIVLLVLALRNLFSVPIGLWLLGSLRAWVAFAIRLLWKEPITLCKVSELLAFVDQVQLVLVRFIVLLL